MGDIIANDAPVRQYALFGYHSAPVGITDGRWVLLRAVADNSVEMYEYTHMPTHMRALFSVQEMRTATLHPGFSFTKGAPVMKIKSLVNPRFVKAQAEGEDLLFDLEQDPAQQHPLDDKTKTNELLNAMAHLFAENDAPDELYARFGLKKP
ncbi:hypothetical protein SDC9_172653 [bioreactor metagenome]|uniref:Sulfatase n=1 Tax=bioreactor metagenome TaxID=1076179 RepID=A0A645GGE6_9ZZZZ